MKGTDVGEIPDPELRELTAEDCRFIIGDTLHEVDEHGLGLARLCGLDAAKEVERVHADLGYPDGFDPYVYALVYARAAFRITWERHARIAQLEQEVDSLEQLCLKARSLIEHLKGGGRTR